MTLAEILNLLLAGSTVASLTGLITMRATARRATADAARAQAEAEAVNINNSEHATRVLIENIVNPLKAELSETREELRATKREIGLTKREMARLRRAVESAAGCEYRSGCPVLHKLQDAPKSATDDTEPQPYTPDLRQPIGPALDAYPPGTRAQAGGHP